MEPPSPSLTKDRLEQLQEQPPHAHRSPGQSALPGGRDASSPIRSSTANECPTAPGSLNSNATMLDYEGQVRPLAESPGGHGRGRDMRGQWIEAGEMITEFGGGGGGAGKDWKGRAPQEEGPPPSPGPPPPKTKGP